MVNIPSNHRQLTSSISKLDFRKALHKIDTPPSSANGSDQSSLNGEKLSLGHGLHLDDDLVKLTDTSMLKMVSNQVNMSRENSKSLNHLCYQRYKYVPRNDERIPKMSIGSRRLMGYEMVSSSKSKRSRNSRRLQQQNFNFPLSSSTNKLSDASSMHFTVEDENLAQAIDQQEKDESEKVICYREKKADSSANTNASSSVGSGGGSGDLEIEEGGYEIVYDAKVDEAIRIHHAAGLLSTPATTDSSSSTVSSASVNAKNGSITNFHEQNDMGQKDKIRVVVRIRPISENEAGTGEQEIISCDQSSLIVEGKQARKFFFDTVFDPTTNQEEVFNYSGIKRLINSAIDGYISTCFAYGQTGSGKTYTMVGPSGAYNLAGGDRYNHFGLMPRSINYLFDQLRQRTQENQSVFYIRVSYFEIYNEQIRDLISPNSQRKLEIRGSQEEGFYVDNLFATYIETMDEMLTVLQEGDFNRSTASHMLNEHSSRSHAILTIQIENELQNSDDPKEQITKLGKMIFVDLAGSEKVKMSMSKGKNLVETNNINKSLLVLGNCISALSDPNKRDGHIPYRDSKLTKLLSESLGGTGITLMIACVSPSSSCEHETLSTLRYASRAQNIENVPLMKSDSRENIIQKLKRELRKLKEENHTLKTKLGVVPIAASLNSSTGRLPVLPKISRNGSSHSNASNDSSLYNKLQEYMHENRTLKSENSQLERFREKVRKQHEILTRENEKLARKLEKVLRDQGQTVKIVQNPGEYVIVNNNSSGGSHNASSIKNNIAEINKARIAKSNSSQLPPIEKQSNGESSERSISPPRKSSPNKNNKFTAPKSTYSEPIGDNVVEEIVLAKPSYTRKFKDIQDFKVKHLNDSGIKKSNNNQVQEMQY